MANQYADGTMQFGSQVSSINSVNYIFDSGSIEVDASQVISNDEVGVPNKQHLVRMVGTGSASLQMAALTTPPPPQFSTFTLFPHGANTANSGEALSFIVKKVGQPFDQNGEKKVTIDFVQKLN
jgi:hypothetical protein